MTVWLARAGRRGRDEETALERGLAIIGYDEVPDLSSAETRDDVLELCRQAYPDDSDPKLRNNAAQLFAFAHRMGEGDIIALPLKSRPQIALGRVKGPYTHQEIDGMMRHTRPVEWVRSDVPRSDFKQDMLYSLGAYMTVCRIERNDAETRFESVIAGQKDPGPAESPDEDLEVEAAEESLAPDIEQMARDQVMSFVEANFKGHTLAELVDAVLQAEGYITRLSSAGPDGGVDVLAGRGSLGFGEPRLCVQVKSSQSPADVNVLRALQGSMQTFKADQGLLRFVGWLQTSDAEGGQAEFLHGQALGRR